MELCEASCLIYLNFVLGSITGLKIVLRRFFGADSGNQDFGKLLSARSQGREKTQEPTGSQNRLHRVTYQILHY